MKKINKLYHAWLDISVGNIVSQPMQRILCNHYVNKINGKIIFELGEDIEFKSYNLQLRNMINSRLKVNGFIFLRLEQFSHNGKLQIDLIRKIINLGYEIHFVRQNLSIKNKSHLKKNLKKLIIFKNILQK